MFNDTKKTIYRQSFLLGVFLIFVSISPLEAGSPKQSTKEGNLLYEQGNYVASEKKFQEALEKLPESDIVNFNLGTVLYKEKEYGEAVDYFQKVFLSEDDQLRLKAYYNSGNALYKMGISQEQKNSATLAIPPIEKSLKQYERALEIDENDEDTKHNYMFVQKELIRLQQKQQQKQQQKGQGQDSKQSENQEEGQGQQSQESQGQEGQKDQRGDQDGQQQQGEEWEGQEGQEDEQDSQQKSAQEGEEEDDKNQQNSGTAPLSASELTLQEAQMLLESYQQSEEPQQLLNMQPRVNYSAPVLKDW